ncbi:dihydroxyacetone kinase [Streptomyces abyssalis]|uniref:Dihydroxyacetone kinase n=2 Tax=Streptomyces abyssalis TaxID=933944 RepID=A0A1E7JK23_9ACTN|nr:dihydroxyacetone kinase subunit DhaK [Streptomyces abyssalis]OEU87997.1 dihydroxyacetone kinase [Streptomyces abyssalis]OEU90859.1 dihydroxyacetone kinase [Streptomyces abyssalis]
MRPLGDASTFKSDWIRGLVAARGRTVRAVPGAYGVMSRSAPEPGRVGVVIGGGCGHYPAFAGLVGPGLADAAAIGDVFTSPSAEQVYRTARAVDGGAGVLFSFGNYAGDVMHFGLAARRLAAEGIASRTVLVTDDVASGPADRPEERRGVAGGFFVFKTAAAAAHRGYPLERVEALARHANARTRTYGAAFAGCTLPGHDEPLFTVESGAMELGLGIHGEAGAETVPSLAPGDLADVLVDRVLDELPPGRRVSVLLNGLGRTTPEDLLICYGRVHDRLVAAGRIPYRPEVGDFVTSLDMAGISLSVIVLDDELAALYDAPCESPGFTRVAGAPGDREAAGGDAGGSTAADVPSPAAPPDGPVGPPRGVAAEVLAAALAVVREHEDELGRLDAVCGDGDHGQGMVRGLRAAVAAAQAGAVDQETPDAVDTGAADADAVDRGAADADAVDRGAADADRATDADTQRVGRHLLRAGTALSDAAGGASGALYGVLLTEIGAGLGRSAAGPVTLDAVAASVDSAFEAVRALGGAEVGEKTLLDALDPFRASLLAQCGSGTTLAQAWAAAADEADRGARATSDLVARRGRAARLGPRGRGHPDAGATSLALMLGAAAQVLARRAGARTGAGTHHVEER